METVDKNPKSIRTEDKTVSCDVILDIIPKFNRVMVGVHGGEPPFEYVYLEVSNKKLIDIINLIQADVTYSIMYNSNMNPKLEDILYINKMKQTVI